MPKPPPKTVTIRGKRWRFELVTLPRGRDGDCHVQPRQIRIRKSLKGQHKLDVIIHEILHAADWDKTEEWVDSTASDIARVLWRLGYREGTDG